MTDSSELTPEFLDSLASFDSEEAQLDKIRETLDFSKVTLDARGIQKILDLVSQLESMQRTSGMEKWFSADGPFPIESLPKHKAFFSAGKDYPERLFMAGNRVGKSIAGCYELACHLTGNYPIWWAGRTFDGPIKAWAVGKDARSVRDTAQRELLGDIGEWGTGMIPAHCIGKALGLQGTAGAFDIVKIRHKTGGWSELGFKNYQQDIGTFMGTTRHAIWLDEECPREVYNECNVRTATVDGIVLVTFTPLDGLTPMVVNFCKKADFLVGAKPIVAVDVEEGWDQDDNEEEVVGRNTPKAVIQAGWADAPWLSAEMKARLLDDTPEHLKRAREFGEPAQGSGAVYPIPIENVLIDNIDIPVTWPRMYALDVGWNQTAALWGALDPVTDTLYIYDEHYQAKQLPSVHAWAIQSRGKWIPGVIDPASRGRSPTDGKKMLLMYKDLGLQLWEAKNEVESGISAITQRLAVGKIKVFKTCINFQKEYLLYSRDKNGDVIKQNDHLMDCMRYIVNNMGRMSSSSEMISPKRMNYERTRYRI